MQARDVSLSSNVIAFHGHRIDGVETRPADVEALEFRACANIIDAGVQVVAGSTFKTEIMKHHQSGQRCFIHVKIRKTETGYIPVGSAVVLREDGTDIYAKDARFKSYVDSYKLEYMIPLYVQSVNTNGFHAGIIGQPWLNTNDLIKKAI